MLYQSTCGHCNPPATQAPAASTQAPAAEPVTPPAAQAPAPETGAGQAVAPEAPTTEAVPAGDAPADPAGTKPSN